MEGLPWAGKKPRAQSRPEELPGIGQYASDAFAIFCEGRWRETVPHDHALRWYKDWLVTVED